MSVGAGITVDYCKTKKVSAHGERCPFASRAWAKRALRRKARREKIADVFNEEPFSVFDDWGEIEYWHLLPRDPGPFQLKEAARFTRLT